MPKVWLDEDLCRTGDLPDVCLKCGQQTTNRVKKTFAWMSPWIYVALLFGAIGMLVFLILAATLRKTIKAKVPMCDEHKRHWLIRVLLVLGSLVAVIGMIVLVVAALSSAPPGSAGRDLMPLLIIAPIVAWVILAIVVSVTAIRALEIRADRGLHLAGVSQEFVDAYKEEFDRNLSSRVDRDALDRWSERRPSRRPEPGRDAEPGDRYRGQDQEEDRRRTTRDRDRDDDY
jgi:hypothetical protein